MSSKRRRPREEPEVPGSFHLSMKDLAEASGEDPLPEKKYKKLFDITWIDTEEEAKAVDKNWCFECIYSTTRRDAERQPVIAKMQQHRYENYHRISPEQMAEQLQEIYNKQGRPHITGNPILRRETIWQHVQFHAPSSVIIQENANKAINMSMNVLADKLVLQSTSDADDSSLDIANMKLYMELFKAQQASNKAVKEARNSAVL